MNSNDKNKIFGSVLFFTGLVVMHLGFVSQQELFVFIGAVFWIGVGTKLHKLKNDEPTIR